MPIPANFTADNVYKTLFQNSYSVMLIIQPESGKILDANTSACNFYGYSYDRLTKMAIQEINILSDEEIFAEMQKAKKDQRHCFNFKHQLANGNLKEVEVHCGPIVIDKNKLLYSVIHDVTERKKIEKQIETEKEFSESLINSLPGIMYICDEGGNITLWNKNLEIVSGYTADQLENLTLSDLISSNDQQRIEASIKASFRGEKTKMEVHITTSSGIIIPFLFTGFIFKQYDVSYTVGIGINISDRIKIEEEKEDLIRQLKKALSKVKQLSGFLPICSSCKKIRDDSGYWNQIETFIKEHSEADFSHSICPECVQKLYPDFNKNKKHR